MADFDLSLAAYFDTDDVVEGGAKVEKTIERMSAAEYRAAQATKQGTAATSEASRAEREHANALKNVLTYIEPNYAAQQRLNTVVADADRLYKSGALSAAQFARVQKLAADAAKQGAQSMGQLRAASFNTAQQIQDVTQQAALGVNPFIILGQQGGQLATALSGAGGAAGKFAAFMAGGWGSAILAGVTVLGLLGTSLLARRKETEDLGDALDFQRMSTEELTKAIREQVKEAEKSNQTGIEAARIARDTAKANLDEAISLREKYAAMLKVQEATLSGGRTGVEGAGAASAGVANSRGEISALDANKADLERLLRLREVPIARQAAEAATDGAAAATQRYAEAERRLRKEFVDGKSSRDTYERGVAGLIRTRDADIKKIREQEAAEKKLAGERAKSAGFASFALPFSSGSISSGYGARAAPKAGASTFHQGIDFAQPTGTPVKVPQAGVVEAIGFSPTLGKYIVVDHGGGTKTRYGHLSDNAVVREGSAVDKGDVIGKVGSTGNSTGPHLHYEVTVNGKRVDPTKGKFPIDDIQVAEAAQKAEDSLQKFADRSAENISRISERWNEQPRLIDQAQASARQLDDTIADLEKRNIDGQFDALIVAAQQAKVAIADGLVRPFEELLEQSERRMTIDRLIAANRENEAEALQRIWQLEEKLGPLASERRAEVLATVEAEDRLSKLLEQRKELTDAMLGATRTVRSELEAFLSGQGDLSGLTKVFQQLKGKVLVEQLFGGAFRDLEEFVKEETAIEASVDIMEKGAARAGEAADDLATSLLNSARRIDNVSSGGADAARLTVGSPEFNAAFAPFLAGSAAAAATATGRDDSGKRDEDAPIIVEGLQDSVSTLSPERYFEEMTKRLVKPFLAGLDETFGTEFFAKFEGVVAGAASGYLTGGVPGGVLGGLKGIKGLGESIDKLTGTTDTLGKGLGGAQTGTMVNGLAEALGLGKNFSKGGAQVGGAIGAFIPIPGGDIIGAIAGGIIGKLIGSTKRGSAIVSSVDGALGTYGNSSTRKEAALGLGGSVQQGLANIIEALGAQAGAFKVSIGVRDDQFYVDPQGRGYTKTSKYPDIKGFGTDESAAIAFAIANAIADGAIKGISPAVAKALGSSPDIEKAVAEALKVRELEALLADTGNELEAAFKNLAEVARERVDLAKRYGLDLLKVEALNAKERQALIDETLESSIGSLRSLLDDLQFGSLFEGSATERRTALLGQIASTKNDAAAGVPGAIDRLADLERQLLSTSLEAFGTAGKEYAADRAQAISTSQQIIEAERVRVEQAAAAAAQAAANSAAQLTAADETNDLLAIQNAKLDQLIALGGGQALVYDAATGTYRAPVVAY